MTAEEYLARLDAELRRVHAAHRRRIVSEVRDHILEGGSERLGDPEALALEFAADSASSIARTASLAAIAAVAATLAVWAAIALDIRSHPWLNDFPGALIAAFAVQVAAVAAFVALVRVVRYRGRVPAPALPLLTRAVGVATISLLVGLAATAAAEANHLRPAQAGTWELAFAAGLGVACMLALAAAGASASAAYRARAFAPAPGDDVAADLLALAPRVAPPWLALRRHPWRACAALATAIFLAVSLGGLVQGGDPSPFVGLIEALAVVAGFAAFGRVLGLRR